MSLAILRMPRSPRERACSIFRSVFRSVRRRPSFLPSAFALARPPNNPLFPHNPDEILLGEAIKSGQRLMSCRICRRSPVYALDCLVDAHGDDAELHAAQRVDAIIAQGDSRGRAYGSGSYNRRRSQWRRWMGFRIWGTTTGAGRGTVGAADLFRFRSAVR
jgi:hypothetical protein